VGVKVEGNKAGVIASYPPFNYKENKAGRKGEERKTELKEEGLRGHRDSDNDI